MVEKNLCVKEEAVFGPFNFALLMVAQRRGKMKRKMGSPQDGQREKGNCSCFTWSVHDGNEYLLPSKDGMATVAQSRLHEVQQELLIESRTQGPRTS